MARIRGYVTIIWLAYALRCNTIDINLIKTIYSQEDTRQADGSSSLGNSYPITSPVASSELSAQSNEDIEDRTVVPEKSRTTLKVMKSYNNVTESIKIQDKRNQLKNVHSNTVHKTSDIMSLNQITTGTHFESNISFVNAQNNFNGHRTLENKNNDIFLQHPKNLSNAKYSYPVQEETTLYTRVYTVKKHYKKNNNKSTEKLSIHNQANVTGLIKNSPQNESSQGQANKKLHSGYTGFNLSNGSRIITTTAEHTERSSNGDHVSLPFYSKKITSGQKTYFMQEDPLLNFNNHGDKKQTHDITNSIIQTTKFRRPTENKSQTLSLDGILGLNVTNTTSTVIKKVTSQTEKEVNAGLPYYQIKNSSGQQTYPTQDVDSSSTKPHLDKKKTNNTNNTITQRLYKDGSTNISDNNTQNSSLQDNNKCKAQNCSDIVADQTQVTEVGNNITNATYTVLTATNDSKNESIDNIEYIQNFFPSTIHFQYESTSSSNQGYLRTQGVIDFQVHNTKNVNADNQTINSKRNRFAEYDVEHNTKKLVSDNVYPLQNASNKEYLKRPVYIGTRKEPYFVSQNIGRHLYRDHQEQNVEGRSIYSLQSPNLSRQGSRYFPERDVHWQSFRDFLNHLISEQSSYIFRDHLRDSQDLEDNDTYEQDLFDLHELDRLQISNSKERLLLPKPDSLNHESSNIKDVNPNLHLVFYKKYPLSQLGTSTQLPYFQPNPTWQDKISVKQNVDWHVAQYLEPKKPIATRTNDSLSLGIAEDSNNGYNKLLNPQKQVQSPKNFEIRNASPSNTPRKNHNGIDSVVRDQSAYDNRKSLGPYTDHLWQNFQGLNSRPQLAQTLYQDGGWRRKNSLYKRIIHRHWLYKSKWHNNNRYDSQAQNSFCRMFMNDQGKITS